MLLFDVHVVRCQMPICDGFVSTSLIRGMANIVQPFICALTANAMEGDAEHCLSQGMDHYMSDHTHMPTTVSRWPTNQTGI